MRRPQRKQCSASRVPGVRPSAPTASSASTFDRSALRAPAWAGAGPLRVDTSIRCGRTGARCRARRGGRPRHPDLRSLESSWSADLEGGSPSSRPARPASTSTRTWRWAGEPRCSRPSCATRATTSAPSSRTSAARTRSTGTSSAAPTSSASRRSPARCPAAAGSSSAFGRQSRCGHRLRADRSRRAPRSGASIWAPTSSSAARRSRRFPRFLDAVLGHSAEALRRIAGLMWRDEGDAARGAGARPADAAPSSTRCRWSIARWCTSPRRATSRPVWRARGCPQRCDFCEVCEIWPRYVSRSDDAESRRADASPGRGVLDGVPHRRQRRREQAGVQGVPARRPSERGFAGMLVTQIRADAASSTRRAARPRAPEAAEASRGRDDGLHRRRVRRATPTSRRSTSASTRRTMRPRAQGHAALRAARARHVHRVPRGHAGGRPAQRRRTRAST